MNSTLYCISSLFLSPKIWWLEKETFIISQFLWSRIRKWLNWVVVAQGLSQGCPQNIGWGCRYLEAWQSLIGGSASRMAHSHSCEQEASFSDYVNFSSGLSLSIFEMWPLPQEHMIQEWARRSQCLLWSTLRSHASPLLPHSIHEKSVTKSTPYLRRGELGFNFLKRGVSKSL